MDEPVDLMPFVPISSLNEKFYPRNINYMPAVKFSIYLDIEPDSEVRDFEMLLNQRTHGLI